MVNNDKNSSKIIFITGGTKSAKSEFAEYLGRKINKLTYVALSEERKDDSNWQKKILDHRKRRPKDWKLVETNNIFNALKNEKGALLIDSIGGFIMKHINLIDIEWAKKKCLLIDELNIRKDIIIIIVFFFELKSHFILI